MRSIQHPTGIYFALIIYVFALTIGRMAMHSSKLISMALISIVLLGAGLFLYEWFFKQQLTSTPIKVGILHSLSGTMAISEKAVVEGELLAIAEINAAGGILGRSIEPVIVDGQSNNATFARLAKKLITEDKVNVVFGCWASSCRKTVKPIFEKYDSLLFYPVQYEGLEQSPNIVYLGAAPNQQIIPAVKWLVDNVGNRFFLVGSDYVFPHAANEIIKSQIQLLGGEIVGEEYLPVGTRVVAPVVQKILAAKPDAILNTINGDTNLPFFRELVQSKVSPDKTPVMSFSIAERELAYLNPKDMVGNYASWSYFESIDSPENKNFVRNFRKKYGQGRVTDDPIETGYFGIYLWAQAVRDANSDKIDHIKRTIKRQSFNAPEGIVYINPENLHSWRIVRIGKIQSNGQFNIVWSSVKPVQPIPFPASRSKAEWSRLLQELYQKWQGNWENRGTHP